MGRGRTVGFGANRISILAIASVAVLAACATSTPAEQTTAQPAPTLPPSTTQAAATTKALVTAPWVEHEVRFSFEVEELYGVLTVPPSPGPHPGIVLISGSGDAETGIRAGAAVRFLSDHSHELAKLGYAVLRYDPPGVGKSTGDAGLPSLDRRVEETAAALQFMQDRPDVADANIGLWGVSQGSWVIAMTAARYQGEAAFLISVVGSAQTVARQQIYGIEAQSRAAGLSESDVSKALVFGRTLIDWQLREPTYRQVNEADAAVLGDGPWISFMELVYEPGDIDPMVGMAAAIDVLKTVQDDPWAAALHLRNRIIPGLEAIPAGTTADELAAVSAQQAQNLTTDPKDFLTQVRIPVLAVFGEDDMNVDSTVSPALFEQYLTDAGNRDYTIVVLPDVGHDLILTRAYWDTMSAWLDQLKVQ